MTAVYSVESIAALKAINPLSVSTPTGTRALYDGEKRSILNTGGYAPSWYTYRRALGSPGWPTGIPGENLPVVVIPTTNGTDGAWVSDSLYKVFKTTAPTDTPVNLFKEINKGVEWIATFASGSTARYISDGTAWKLLFISAIYSTTVNPPVSTPEEIGQYFIYNDGSTKAVYFSVGTTGSFDWIAL